MLNLGIECSGTGGSVALLRRDQPIFEQLLSPDLGSIQCLASTVQNILSLHSVARVDLISVTIGPGSFTGLRVGLATAKMLAYAWNIPIVGVDSLHAIAFRIGCQRIGSPNWLENPEKTWIISVANAFRRQVFASAWLLEAHSSDTPVLAPVAPSQVLDADDWQDAPLHSLAMTPSAASWVDSNARPAFLLGGPGLRNYLPKFPIELVPDSLWDPTAAVTGKLGWLAHLEGRSTNSRLLMPNYVRASAAEEAGKRK